MDMVSIITRSSLDPVLQLQLLLSRLELSEEQECTALALCDRIDDWTQVSNLAYQRFVLPLVYRHLCKLSPDSLPPEQLKSMRRICLTVVRHNLHVAAAHRKLIDDLLYPLGIPHLFFKGHSLAARYYDEPAIRSCRDIDLLVSHDHMVELLESALSMGYKPFDPVELTADRVSLSFVARAQRVVTLLSPQGILIELHQCIDKTGSLYEPSELLTNAETLTLGDNNEILVMPTAELFVYVCMHHTRHQWNHLHWLVDLDAIQRHPSFDWDAVYSCASRRNLTATVEASQELYKALASPDPLRYHLSANGKEMLRTCLTVLQGDLVSDAELALRKKRVAPDFTFAWQSSAPRLLHWRVQAWISHCQPSYKDYHSWPLPLKWQWLYFFTRPFRELYKRLSSDSYTK